MNTSGKTVWGGAVVVLSFAFGLQASAEAPVLTLESTVVGAALQPEGVSSSRDILVDLALGYRQAHLFDNGVEIGMALEGRAQQDAQNRPGFLAGFGLSDPALPSIRSPASGLSVAQQPFDEGVRASIEQGYVYLRFGWGEFAVGKDAGVASRLDARAPDVMQLATTFSPRLDPTGVNLVRARNDVSGQSFKVSYETPRLLGLKLGVSYAPKAHDPGGLDFAPGRGGGVNVPDVENVLEGAASFSRRFRDTGIRLRASLTATHAEAMFTNSDSHDYSALGAGLELEWKDWSAGLRWLNADNAVSDGHYTAVELGVVREMGDWSIGAAWGQAEDELQGLEGASLNFGVSRRLSKQSDLAVSWRRTESDHIFMGDSSRLGGSDGLIIELSVHNR